MLSALTVTLTKLKGGKDAENLKLAEERKAKITYTAVIDDGITKRVLSWNRK